MLRALSIHFESTQSCQNLSSAATKRKPRPVQSQKETPSHAEPGFAVLVKDPRSASPADAVEFSSISAALSGNQLQLHELCWEPLLSYALGMVWDSGLMFHLLIFMQGKEHAEKDPQEQSIKQYQDGTIRKF